MKILLNPEGDKANKSHDFPTHIGALCYSADFGVTGNGDTLLVEINDGYSLGHGALTSNLYAELLEARWLEMTDEAS